jgi:hypothetical protein
MSFPDKLMFAIPGLPTAEISKNGHDDTLPNLRESTVNRQIPSLPPPPQAH